jgi:hypothetical protein
VDRGKAHGQNWLQTGGEFCLGHYFCFGVPKSIITDNSTHFIRGINIRVDKANLSPTLHTNGQVERVNGVILQGLKCCILTHEGENVHTRLITRAGKWTVEVPSVLWSICTMPNRSTNFTPFFMVYGSDVVLPSELQYGSPRVLTYQLVEEDQAGKDTID